MLATPVHGLDDKSMFVAYKTILTKSRQKDSNKKLNVMENQSTKHIKQFLTKNKCKLQLIEPHNQCDNLAERTIQTFKDAFITITAFATTNSDFPLQFWDNLMPQVQDTLNIMRLSHVNPEISVYEAINSPYNWNRHPLAPLKCKAVIYKDEDTQRSWSSHGFDGWYLGPSQDHYRCDLYFVPETRAYCLSGSLKLFP